LASVDKEAIKKYDTDAISNSFGMLQRGAGRLFVEGVAVEDLVARHGSPLFVVSETALRRRARRIRDAFRRAWPAGDVLVMPSVKANPVVALQRILAQEGFGADLVHASELEVAVRAGIEPALISLNGSGKDRATVERAVELGARITIDDVREIELARAAAQAAGKRAVIRLRLRPYVDTDARMEATGIPIADAYGTYKSGIPHDDLAEAGKALSMPELDVSGVMMHMGRYTTDLDVIGRFSHRFGELAAELSDMWDGWTPATIDIGGGFAPPVDGFGRGRADFADPQTPPEIEQYAEVICRSLECGLAAGGISPEGRALEVEPGRSLFAPCGIHVATVLNVKRQTHPFPFVWIDTDTSVTFLSDIQYSSARLPVLLVDEGQRAPESLEEVRIVGHSCHADVLARSAFLPPLEEGELLAFCFTGAYHEVGASNFNVMPRPATVLVRDTDSHLVRRAENVNDVLARDTVPGYLSLSDAGAAS
jgi:diaminopimelate decarboxylase